MNWFVLVIDALSALFLLAAAVLTFLYAREFFMERPPVEWYIVGAGTIIVALGTLLGFYRFQGVARIGVALLTTGGVLTMTFGFFRAYKRSTGGMQ